jgi:heparanase
MTMPWHGHGIAPATMPRIGTVDERFQSFNVEMVEVIGGRFWKPYGTEVDAILQAQPSAPRSGATPVGMDPALFQARPPIDLANPRLRTLAAALGPAYMRVSGTWANTTYFHDSDAPAPSTPPEGFTGVLTRQQWKGVVDFAHAVNAKIVTSFATSAGTRDAAGVWTPAQARRFLAYTTSIGGSIAVAEYMNEPTVAEMGGAPKGYDAAAYARDIAVFHPFVKEAAPDMVLLGPGSVGEGIPLFGALPLLTSKDLLTATGPVFDAFSYHFYGAVSKRCAATMPEATTTAEAALSEEWLSRTDIVEAFYARLRDRFEPGKPLWITETADAACGGNPWAATFLDSFRYLDQLGRLAKRGVQVIIHNTLASSDYGLLDETTLTPRPNYWAALLWRRLMGPTVLDAGPSPVPDLHLYAHCLRDHPGGVAVLVINTDRTISQALAVPVQSDRYTLTATDLLSRDVQLNGRDLSVGPGGDVPQLTGTPTQAGTLVCAPTSITFLAIPNAQNSRC